MRLNIRFVFAVLTVVTVAALRAPELRAQQVIPLQNENNSQVTEGGPLEVETVEIHRGTAIPSALQRPAGRFILLVVNGDRAFKASFVVDPAAVGDGQLGPNPLVRVTDSGPASAKHRVAAMLDLTAGDFHLKSAATGKVLCRIHID